MFLRSQTAAEEYWLLGSLDGAVEGRSGCMLEMLLWQGCWERIAL